MRNLKRALSLGLTAAMISGLMVMGSSAASYADVTSEDNVEAIEVLQTVGIMVGDENGDFNPDQNVTRNEMAVIMSNLMEYNVASYKDTSPFTDVPSWAEPYVAACWTNGITAGTSATTYGGSDTVTTAQAALMLMKALGYFQYSSDFGADWQLATVKQGNAIDLFVGVDSGVEQAMTRNDVAQLVLNTLEAGTVQAETNGSLTVGNVTIATDVKYNYITSNADYAQAIDSVTSTDANTDAGRSIVELGEQLYMGDLELNDNALDVFGRPARTWTYDSQKIGTYMKTELLKQEYTTKVTGRNLYDLLGSNVIDTYSFRISVDGETERSVLGNAYFTTNQMTRSYTDAVGETGDGVLTQVFVDNIDKEVNIAVINTYLAKATNDYDDKKDELDLDVYSIEDVDGSSADVYVKNTGDSDGNAANGLDPYIEDMTISGDDFAIADYVEDDLILVTVADGEIQTIADPEILDSVTISNFKRSDYVTSDGTQYDYADTVTYDPEVLDEYDDSNMKDLTYNIILDPYGYMIGIELNEDPDQYLFLTGIDLGSSNLSKRNADANVIFMDGTMDTVTVDMRDSKYYNTTTDAYENLSGLTTDTTAPGGGAAETRAQLNSWFTYTVDSNGVYTLEQVADEIVGKANEAQSGMDMDDEAGDEMPIDQKNVALDGSGSMSRVYGNDETVYLVVDHEDDLDGINDKNGNNVLIIDDVSSVITGVKNANITAIDVGNYVDDDATTYYAPENEVYTLYDEDGYVIAAVVIGEDAGVSSNYAYVTSSDVNREADNTGDDTYTWTREAVVDGVVVELTEVGTHLDVLDTLDQGHWYEVKYDANGYVRSATEIIFNKNENGADDSVNRAEDEFVPIVEELADQIGATAKDTLMREYDTIVLADQTTVQELSYKAGTLYTTTDQTEGFSVAAGVKTVLILADREDRNGNYDIFDSVEDGYEGYDGLQDALDDMNAVATYGWYGATGTRMVEVHAIIEDGAATSIIINDKAPADTTNSAARIDVAVNPAVPSVVEGNDITLTANVTRAAGETQSLDMDNVTYQWYVNDGTGWATIPGATGRTYTIENAAMAMDNYQYACEATNTDTRHEITGVTERTATSVPVTLEVTNAKMQVIVTFELQNGTYVGEGEFSVTKPATGSVARLVLDNDDVAEYCPNYVLAGSGTKLVNFVAGGVDAVTVIVARGTATLNLPTGVEASWAAGIGYDAKASQSGTVTVPAGVEVTLSGTGLGKYNSQGDEVVEEYILNVGENKTVAATDVGYYKVTLTKASNLDNYTLSEDEFYLKPNGATETFTLVYTADDGLSDWSSVGLDSISDLTLNKGTPYGGDDGNDNISYTIQLTASKNVDATLEGSWS